jgi:sugar/nucleoside kinase (ribokinase family)
VLGGATFDLHVTGLPRLPTVDRLGDEFTDQSLLHLSCAPVQSVGGNAGNIAYVLGRLGAPVRLYTAIGDDPLGRALRRWLADVGCETTLVGPERTSVNFVATDDTGGRTSYFYPVALDRAATLALCKDARFRPGDHLALAGYPHPETDVLHHWVDRARAAGATVSLDIGPTSAGFRLPALLRLADEIDIVFCNERELSALDSSRRPEDLADQVAARLHIGLVIKRGASGCEFRGGPGYFTLPAARVPARSTVGAGDAFDAGFIHATVLGGRSIASGLGFSSALVALMLERGRGVNGAPTSREIHARDGPGNDN